MDTDEAEDDTGGETRVKGPQKLRKPSGKHLYFSLRKLIVSLLEENGI